MVFTAETEMPGMLASSFDTGCLGQSRRSLHLSTWLILGGIALALLMIVVPGETDNRYYARDFQLQEHGWPWVHLYRFVPKADSDGEGREQVQQRLQSYRDHGNPLP